MRVNQNLEPLHSFRGRKVSTTYVPDWLQELLGAREREILYHPQVRLLHEDQEGNRYPAHQQWIESPVGTMLIDAKRQCILG